MSSPCFTAGQLVRAVQADAPLLLLLAVDVSARSDGLGLPCRVVGTLSQESAALPMAAASPAPAVPEEPEHQVSRMLSSIGVPTNLLGYAYLRTALILMLRRPEISHGLTRGLYPEVACQHGTTARCVERAIRHAISQTWVRSGGAGYERLLGRMGSTVGERPTNSEFLAQVAEGLRLEMTLGA